jgi:hypothetical protein
VLTALGPFGIAVATGAAVLGTIAVSAFKTAKGLGEYGTRVKSAELRTGLAAKEVGQFGFAARVVGPDISIAERLMRGLSPKKQEYFDAAWGFFRPTKRSRDGYRNEHRLGIRSTSHNISGITRQHQKLDP